MDVTGTAASAQAAQVVAAAGTEASATGGFLFPGPNIVDFRAYLANAIGISATVLPANSPWPEYALAQALALVLCRPIVPVPMYTLAVYNCATHLVFLITPDQIGQTYFVNARGTDAGGFGLIAPSTGIVVSSSDQGSSAALAQPDWAVGLTIGQLGFFKTPWGRAYLEFNQSFGPTIWGLT